MKRTMTIVLNIVCLVVFLSLISCSKDDVGGSKPSAILVATPAPLDFGAVSVGGTAAADLVVTNTGERAATGITVSAGPTVPFTYGSGAYPAMAGTCGGTLLPGETCTIPIIFSPDDMGSWTGEIEIQYDNGIALETTKAPLAGTGRLDVARLVAVADEDRELTGSAADQAVTLDGRKSFYLQSAAATTIPSSMNWFLVSGPAVVSVPADTARPIVTIPADITGMYQFRLTAAHGGLIDTDDLMVEVKPFRIIALDNLHTGFSVTSAVRTHVTITTAVSGTPAGPLAWTWSGAPGILSNVTGQTTATLDFDLPMLAELQPLPALPGPLGLWGQAGDYHRLTVTATDGVTTDSEDILINLGANTTGLETVPQNYPVFLAGGASDTGQWTWTVISTPPGSPTALKLYAASGRVALGLSGVTSEPAIWFVPQAAGDYELLVVRDVAGTATSAVIRITAAGYVSDGVTATVLPPDAADGKCAACHNGSVPFLADHIGPWRGTAHAHLAANVIDTAYADIQSHATRTYIAPELSYVFTGVHLGSAPSSTWYSGSNAGFDDLAANAAVSFKGMNWTDLATRYPQVARLGQVQCEACHGPGSLHRGDSRFIAETVKVDVCGRCHDSLAWEWAASGHAGVVPNPVTSTACVRCHTAEAATDARAIAFRYPESPPALPIPTGEGLVNTATCASCHDPHSAQYPNQLRLAGPLPLPGGTIVEAGNAAICFHCHNSRRPPALAVAGRNDPHPAAEGDMVAGINGDLFTGYTYTVSPHSQPLRFVKSNGASAGDWCLGCHKAPAPAAGDPLYRKVGGHSFAVRDSATEKLHDPCLACHVVFIGASSLRYGTSREEYLITARDDWDGQNGIQTVQEEVAGLMKLLGGSTAAAIDAPYGIVSAPSDTASLVVRMAKLINPAAVGIITRSGQIRIVTDWVGPTDVTNPASADGDLLHKAMWNYNFVINDGTFGLHNTAYTVGLLQSTIIELRTRLNDPPFSGTLYSPL